MHHALQIQEVLFNVFDHCRSPSTGIPSPDLPALARTCRAFKEPALDVLWRELLDPSPLARCLPEAHQSSLDMCYSFCRSLTQIEWGILRSYARRIRSILDEDCGFDWKSVRIFLNPPTTEPLFPNLRYLRATRSTGIKHLLHMPLPSLVSLCTWLTPQDGNLYVHQAPLESISKFSPDIKMLSISLYHDDIPFNKFFSKCFCRWQNLQVVDCPSIALDMDSLAHLSCMSALTQLSFKLSARSPNQIAPCDSPLFFSNLGVLKLDSDSLDLISRLLSRIRLPAVTDFTAYIENCPSKQDVSSFSASIQISSLRHTIREILLTQILGMCVVAQDRNPAFGFEDLQPCTAFSNLRRVEVNVNRGVDLSDSKLLALALAWPHLEHLLINEDFGWNTPGGITPNGLLQLLQTCRSLSRIALAMDTRGYTECLPSPTGLGLTLPPKFSIDVLDSIIEAESVAAVGAFFADIAPHPGFSLRVWEGYAAMYATVYKYRWFEAHSLAIEAVDKRSRLFFWGH